VDDDRACRKALGILDRLTEHIRKRRGGDTLWRVLSEGGAVRIHISAEIVRQLNTFRDHLNAQFGTPQMPIVSSGPDGKPWHITTRQFRRTIALAHRQSAVRRGRRDDPVQACIRRRLRGAMPARVRSGFRNEVERERALAPAR